MASSFRYVLNGFRQQEPSGQQVSGHDRDDSLDSDVEEEAKLLTPTAAARHLQPPPSYQITLYKVCVALLLVIIGVLSYVLAGRNPHSAPESQLSLESKRPIHAPGSIRKAVVVASWSKQDVSWIPDVPSDWEIYRYMLDDPAPAGGLTVPRNQGRETMAYLTYIIDHYSDLPDHVVFVHGHNRSWHQPEALSLKVSALNLTALSQQGYINMRCERTPGCTPDTYIAVANLPKDESRIQAKLLPGFWRTMFPEELDYWGMGPMPDMLGVPCCAQFAVSKQAIEARSLEFWKMYRRPIERDLSEYKDDIGEGLDWYTIGMLYEKVWHMVFGMDAIYCPEESYCREVQWSNAIKCSGYTGFFQESEGWEDIVCTAND